VKVVANSRKIVFMFAIRRYAFLVDVGWEQENITDYHPRQSRGCSRADVGFWTLNFLNDFIGEEASSQKTEAIEPTHCATLEMLAYIASGSTFARGKN